MDNPYRKFFLFTPLILILFACALPNFAALAPAPAPTESVDPPSATTVSNGGSVLPTQTAAVIDPPSAPQPVTELPTALPPLSVADAADTAPTQLDIGTRYQLTDSAQFVHTPPSGQSLVYAISSGAQLEFASDSAEQIGELIVVETDVVDYYLVPFSPSAVLKIDAILPDRTVAAFEVNFLFEQPEDQLQWTTSVPEDEVTRAEFDGTVNRPFLVELRPAIGFDGVLEIYDSDGLLLSEDENGAGENEFAIFTPAQTGRLTFVISGYLGAGGDFELSVTQFPD